MQNFEKLVALLKEEVPNSLDSVEMNFRNQNPRSEDFIRMFLQCIDKLNYTIVPKKVELMAEDAAEFENVIKPWVRTQNDDDEITIESSQILYDLLYKGWLIIPKNNS